MSKTSWHPGHLARVRNVSEQEFRIGVMNKTGAMVPRYRLPGGLRILTILLLMATCGATADDGNVRDPRAFFFAQSFGDFPEELQTAREQGKLGILLFFESEACRYCAYMFQHVFNQKQVQEWYQERFMSIAVDIHGDVEIKDFDGITLPSKVFSDHRRVFLTPTVSFIDLNGNEIFRHVGMVKTPEEFLLMGEYIADKQYFDTEYRVYAKNSGVLQAGKVLSTPAEENVKKGTSQ